MACLSRLQCKILSAMLALSVFGSARAALVNPDFKISPDVTLDSLSAAAGSNNYLAVWRDLSGGSAAPVIQGALIGSTNLNGTVSPSFSISNSGGLPVEGPVQRIRVAFDGVNFLVVWADKRPGGVGVRGALVTSAGAVVNNSDFLIASTLDTTGVDPQVLFSGSDYFVAWMDQPMSASGKQIYFTRVATTGTHGMILSVPLASGHAANQSLELLIKGPGNETLLVYQDLNASPVHTRALRLNANNSALNGAQGTQMFTNDFSQTGAGVPVGGAFFNGAYTLLTSKGSKIDCSIGRSYLRTDGSISLSTAPFALVGQGRAGLAEDNFPRVFFNGQDGVTAGTAITNAEFIFPRNTKVSDIAYHIMMKRVNADGTDLDPNPAVLDSAGSGGLNGAVAAAIGSQYLVVWMDGRRRAADPPFQTNVFGVLIDSSQPGNILKPYTRPAPGAGPLTGIAPLTVGFGFGNSTGLVDSVLWEFGDGASETKSVTTHKYANAGTYVAVYSLVKTGLYFSNNLRVFVEDSAPGAAGGPPQTVSGIPLDPSSKVNAEVLIDNLTAKVEFAKTSADAFRMTGILNPTRIPVYYPGKTVTATVGSKTYTFKLNNAGGFNGVAGSKPFVSFQMNTATGAFALGASAESLANDFAAVGAKNETVTKVPVAIPVSFSFEGMSSSQSVHGLYTATAGASGKFTYTAGTSGYPDEGYVHVFNGQAVEKLSKGKTGDPFDSFQVLGVFRIPDGKKFELSNGGNWRVVFGNFAQDIPNSAFKLSGDVFTYKPPAGTTNGAVYSLAYSRKEGTYSVSFKSLPASGLTPCGIPPSTTAISRADMALSFKIDLDDGSVFQGGGYLRLKRKDVSKKKWTLR